LTQPTIRLAVRQQFRPLIKTDRRYTVCVAHRRAGKTVAAIQRLLLSALGCEKPMPRCGYIAPTYGQAKAVAWDYLKEFSRGVVDAVHESELRVTLIGGATVRLFGAENYDALRGLYFDDVVLDEYADMRPDVWTVIRPALSDRPGRALIMGTPKGRNEFFKVYDDAVNDAEWLALKLRASETGLLPEAELADAAKRLSPEQYQQEYECSFDAAVIGSYYGRLLDEAQDAGRIGVVPIDKGAAVHTAWDLGIGDSTAIWFFQAVGREIRVIDYHEASGEALDHYAKVLQARGYVYGEHYLPHDAEARELGTGTTRLETLAKLGVRGKVVPAQAKDDSINAARMLIPRCWFDAERCRIGLEALRLYRRDFDERLKTFRDRPRHDWTSHAADAFAQFAIGHREHAAPDMAAVRARLRQGRSSGWMAA
jgi:hypothetical protein